MHKSVKIEDIEAMRRVLGIEDVELREGIRRLQAGDFVKLTLRDGLNPSRAETLLVKITSMRGGTFRGKLASSPATPGLASLAVGAFIVFTAAQIHSLAKRRPTQQA